MKKLFIAASLIIGMIAGVMVLSSFGEPIENGCQDGNLVVVEDNYIWAGYALESNGFRVGIKVYRNSQQRLYSIITEETYNGEPIGTNLLVYDNPDYSVTCGAFYQCYPLYVTTKVDGVNRRFYFDLNWDW